MGKACSNPSTNPARSSSPCIYVIQNRNPATPTAYVGYALNARHRWMTRTEVFHHVGVTYANGKNIKCAWCYPKISNRANPSMNNSAHWTRINRNLLKGEDRAEHLLIRCMIKGVMGVVTVTNTQMVNTIFDPSAYFPGLSKVIVSFSNRKFIWPSGNDRYDNVGLYAY